MATTIVWENNDKSDYSIEYFNSTFEADMIVMKGTVILLIEKNPMLVTYEIICDKYWKTRSVKINQQTSDSKDRNIGLLIDQSQIWRKSINEQSSYSSTVLDFAFGIYDVDLQVTPATNTLPINRLALKEGESQEIAAVWISFPDLTLDRQKQKYSRIDKSFYLFEIASIGLRAQLEVDESGFIINYDTFWHRLTNVVC
jgi:hypothetical protein